MRPSRVTPLNQTAARAAHEEGMTFLNLIGLRWFRYIGKANYINYQGIYVAAKTINQPPQLSQESYIAWEKLVDEGNVG